MHRFPNTATGLAALIVCGFTLPAEFVGAAGAQPPKNAPRNARLPGLFSDVTRHTGLQFFHESGAEGNYYLPEEIGAGGAFLDFDNDGDLDIFLVQSGSLSNPNAPGRSRLFRNDNGRTFVDVTERSFTRSGGYGMGVACGDYDNDGDVDIYVTRLGPNTLLRNNGNGTFSDTTDVANVANVVGVTALRNNGNGIFSDTTDIGDAGDAGVVTADAFSTAAAFLDYDGDGRLDLYVANYVAWTPQREASCYDPSGIRDYCHPDHYPPAGDRLYHNLGKGRFEDVTEKSGISAEIGNGLGVLCSDFNGDGAVDIYVANDQMPAFLWINQRDGTFRNEALLSGCAFNSDGVAIAGMGVAAEDFDGDGDFDLLVTNIHQQSHLCLRNDGGMFEDVSRAWGFGGWSVPYTGFGVGLFDQDHDGKLDGFVANGAVNRLASPHRAGHPYAEPNQFVRRDEGGVFYDASDQVGAALGAAQMSRGVVLGDYDNDGDIDVLITNNRGPVQLLRNENDSGLAWVLLDLVDGSGKRNAINARAEIRAGGRTFVREVRPQASYLSSHDPRPHFGLGAAERIERLTITWPDGQVEHWEDLPVRLLYRVRQGGTPEGVEMRPPSLAQESRPAEEKRARNPLESGARPREATTGPPAPRLERTEGGTRVARLDPEALRVWCRSAGLPDPPALEMAEPDVAEALMEALSRAAQEPTADALGLVGMISASLGDEQGAERYYLRAAALDGREFRWPYYLGCLQQEQGRNDEAIESLLKSLGHNADYATTYARLGQLYLEAKRLDDAQAVLRRYVESRPDDCLGYVGLGRVALGQRNYKKALEYLKEGLRRDPGFFQCHYYLGQTYAGLGNRAKAAEHLARAGQLPQGHWFAMRDPLDLALKQSARSAQSLVDEFARLQHTGDWDGLARLAERIIERRSGDTSMMGNLGSLYCKLGKFDAAQKVIARGLATRPESARLRTLLAEALLGLGKEDAALAAASAATKLDPEFGRGYAVRGRILIRLNRLGDAERDLSRALELEPGVPGHSFVLAELFRATGRSEQAVPLYERVLRMQPGHPHARRRLESIGDSQ